MKSFSAALGAIGVAAMLTAGCQGSSSNEQAAPAAQPRGLRIGFLMDTTHERWQRDRDLFIEQAKSLDAHVVVEAAEGDKTKQAQLADKMLADGVKALVIVPNDTEAAAAIVEKAKAQKVPVISYDRLIRNADIDVYVSFDNKKVGELQAQYLLSHAPTGNYLLVGGSPTDDNAKQVREGQMDVLKPAIASGKIKIVGDGFAENWSADAARQLTEEALKKTRNKLAAVVASNDQTAGGVIEALTKHGLAGKVLVSGQDAELDAAQRIAKGTQTMTVYKPPSGLARTAATAAVRLAQGVAFEAASRVNNGKKDVPAHILAPITVDKATLEGILVNDGFHKRSDIFGTP